MNSKNVNILVQYDGGGYDGCIWEWNFFYIDKNGNFENIFASGSGGIKKLKDAQELIERNGNQFSSKVYIYHMDKADDLKELATELNAVLLQGLVKWFNNYNVPEAQPYAICGECGAKLEDYQDIALEDWHGCGGIMSTADTLLCYECRNTNSCSYCGEYYGSEPDALIIQAETLKEKWDLPKNVAETVIENYAPVCEYCAETLVNRELDRLIAKTKKKNNA